jgi:DNA-binding CsgD family transcriptional regulator/PAS domain-containing protein
MPPVSNVSELVSAIYDASLDHSRWPVFLELLAGAVGAAGTVLHLQSTTDMQSGHVMAALGVDPALQREYEEYYASVNIWTIRGRDRLREGAVLTGQMVCADEELERSEYYNDYLKRLGFFHALTAVPAANDNLHLLVTSFRSKERGPFSERAYKLLQHLSPHLQRAAQIHQRVSAADFERTTMGQALDRMPSGVVLLDGSRRVLFANAAARALAASEDGFALTGDGIVASARSESRLLAQRIASAANPSAADGRGGVLTLSRPTGKLPLQVLVTPLEVSGQRLFQAPQAAVAVFVVDPSGVPAASVDALRQLYALTPSEVRVARGLLRGESVEQLADRLGLTQQTARWVIKQILQKTDTHSQAQVVARLSRGVAALALADSA